MRYLIPILAMASLAAVDGRPTFAEVSGIFKKRCMPCHNSAAKMGKLDLSSYKGVMKGGSSGKAVVAGKGSTSLLVQCLTGEKKPVMPQGKDKLPQVEIDTIRRWIDLGARED